MKQKIIAILEKNRKLFESAEMCYMAISGGFEFEVKNKLAYGLQKKHNKNYSISFIKEAIVGNEKNKTKTVDIISVRNVDLLKTEELSYKNGTGKLNQIIGSIEIGHNYLSQSAKYIMHKTSSDIANCRKANITDNLYIIQIATDIKSIGTIGHVLLKPSYFNGVKRFIEKKKASNCLTSIRTFYQTVDAQFKELSFKNRWKDIETEIHIFLIKA